MCVFQFVRSLNIASYLRNIHSLYTKLNNTHFDGGRPTFLLYSHQSNRSRKKCTVYWSIQQCKEMAKWERFCHVMQWVEFGKKYWVKWTCQEVKMKYFAIEKRCTRPLWTIDGDDGGGNDFHGSTIIVAHREWNHDHEESPVYSGKTCKNQPWRVFMGESRKIKEKLLTASLISRMACFCGGMDEVRFEISTMSMAMRRLYSRRNLMNHQMKYAEIRSEMETSELQAQTNNI